MMSSSDSTMFGPAITGIFLPLKTTPAISKGSSFEKLATKGILDFISSSVISFPGNFVIHLALV